MAVSTSALNALNVFSSTSVFNSNKSSVNANDLNFIKQTTQELATEGGGIIAQSLGTNGYVKFANGLILQWGYVRNGAAPQSVNFPISYTASVLSIHVTPIYAGGYTPSGFVHSAITLSSVKLNAQRWDTASYHAELGTYYWTSIGV